MKFAESHFFVVGFIIGSSVILVPLYFYNEDRASNRHQISIAKIKHFDYEIPEALNKFNESLSNNLFNEVKILCMVMTHPENHQKKAIHVLNTWGKRCNKLLFMSSKVDLQLDTVVLPFEDSRKELWNKTKAGFQYLYDNYLDDYDWFMKADDDNYIVIENVRYMLGHYNPKTALYFGHRFAASQVDEGYMAGGGYILSKKALIKFSERIVKDTKKCFSQGAEDLAMGRCLAHSAIFVDCQDELHQKRFFPLGVEFHMKKPPAPTHWYAKSLYYNSTYGNTSCCSDTSVGFHYVRPRELYALDYFIYKAYPFGLDDHSDDEMPKKLALNEIIAASDAHSAAPNFKVHKNYHDLEPSEIY